MPKPSRTKEMIKMRVKINEIENRKQQRGKKGIENQTWFFESSAKLTKI